MQERLEWSEEKVLRRLMGATPECKRKEGT